MENQCNSHNNKSNLAQQTSHPLCFFVVTKDTLDEIFSRLRGSQGEVIIYFFHVFIY